MGADARCCHETWLPSSDDGNTLQRAPTQRCDAAVNRYRTCGLGCKYERAYCASHGGEARAENEMICHHITAHGMPPLSDS